MDPQINPVNPAVLQRLIDAALREDLGTGEDVTTRALVPSSVRVPAHLLTLEPCRVAGVDVARGVFEAVDANLRCRVCVPDGADAPAGTTVLAIEGPACAILTAERTALNFMQRMCGIATLTARFVAAVAAYGTRILDTRKTTPGLRVIEKYSVRCGGGFNHRMGLYDRVLIKDNHRRLWHAGDPGRLDLAVAAARTRYPGLEVEIEVESLAELHSALRGRPEWLLLDNMSLEMMCACVEAARGISRLEASGGIGLANVTAVAATGVDAISLGCLTHSAPAIDLSLEIV